MTLTTTTRSGSTHPWATSTSRPHPNIATSSRATRGAPRGKYPDEISELLGAAGFTHVEIEPVAPQILIGGGGTVDDSIDFFLGMGIVRGLLGQGGPDALPKITADVRAALAERYEPGVGVRLDAGAWLVSARK